MPDAKNCFVIAPIGETDSEIRKRSDQVLKHVISPAVEKCGYKAVRADQISEPGMITSQVIQHVVDDPLVVADLTGRNPNVFYELALRHALRKPLVQLIKKGEQIPFDVAGTRTIFVDHHDLDSVEEARAEMIKQIHSLEKNSGDIETPISVSLDLQLLKQSENPEERSLGDLLAAVTEVRTALSSLEKRIEDPEKLLPPPYLRSLVERYGGRSRIPPHFVMELRELTERLMARVDSEKAGTKKETAETMELLHRLRKYTMMLMHEVEF